MNVERTGPSILWSYRTSNSDSGEVVVRYPFDVEDLATPTLSTIGLGVAVYLGQLCLAEVIEVGFPVTAAMAQDVAPLAAMLYDIRRWKDGLPLVASPYVLSNSDQTGADVPPSAPTGRRALLLWSGGKDSSLSALLLRANGYDVVAAHATANSGVEKDEVAAIERLASRMELDPVRVAYRHDEFLSFSSRYAVNWNQPPLCNTVPFGRDLLLALLAVPVALKTTSSLLSMGHDHECRNAYVTVEGRSVPRNDVESTAGALALERFLAHAAPALRLLPPVSGLSELRILKEMLVNHSELMRDAAFCFWGGNCGRCAKCLRYYLAQRLFGVDVLEFKVNPLGAEGAPELDDVLRLDADGVLFQTQILLCLGRLVERGDVRAQELRLSEFRRDVYERVAEHLDEWEQTLMAVGDDPQLPSDWSYS